MTEEIAIKLSDVNKKYVLGQGPSSYRDFFSILFKRSKKKEIEALRNISFEVRKGEILGIIGRNGSGKSTLLKAIIGAIKPDTGTIDVRGKMMRLELGFGFDRGMTAYENIILNGVLLGIPKDIIVAKVKEIIAYAELEEFENTKVKYLSKGMKSRLAFSIAVHAEADILLFDEFFGGVGDIKFKEKSDAFFLDEFIRDKTVVIVSHSLKLISKVCHRAILIEKGQIVKTGDAEEVVKYYEELSKG
jgi:ABC-type polysaccharide/polyol phosphate transport system ATPase subunit